jgi:hypothetical protein
MMGLDKAGFSGRSSFWWSMPNIFEETASKPENSDSSKELHL